MEIKIARLDEAENLLRNGWPTMAISLVDEDVDISPLAPRHLILNVEDIEQVTRGHNQAMIPAARHVRAIIDFVQDVREDDRLLIHCHMGLGRSPATAIGVLVLQGYKPEPAVALVGKMRPMMIPNKKIVEQFDEILGLRGKLIQAVAEWGCHKLHKRVS